MPHPISKWPARPLSRSLYPGYKSGLRTPVQYQFSLELVHCSNSVSHSNKLYFPLILSYVWKFFSNSHLDHDIFVAYMGTWGLFPTSSLLLSHRDPLWTGRCCGSNWGTLARVTLWCVPKAHSSLSPSSCHPNGWGSLLCLLSNWGLGQEIFKTETIIPWPLPPR